MHEAKHVFSIFRRKLGMRVTKNDMHAATNEKLAPIDKSIVFKDRKYRTVRKVGSIRKLSRNTGIPESRLDVENVQISSKNVDIAWITFGSKETVRNVFKQAAFKQTGKLNVFPVIPDCGLERKKNVKEILKTCTKWIAQSDTK